MSLSLDLVLNRVRQASPREFEDFARALAENLSNAQLDIVEQVLEQERQQRARQRRALLPRGVGTWGIS